MKKNLSIACIALLLFSCKKKDDPQPQANRAPVVVDQDYAVDANSSGITINLLTGDTDPDGDVLSFDIASVVPYSGVYSISFFAVAPGQPNTSVVITPMKNCAQDGYFVYTVTDGKGGKTTAKATIRVGTQQQKDTYSLIENHIGSPVFWNKNASNTFQFDSNRSTITTAGSNVPYVSGATWSLNTDGTITLDKSGTTTGIFAVGSFTDATGNPAFTLNQTNASGSTILYDYYGSAQ